MKVDVAVVGAGTAGLVTASVLAQQGKKVALVERERTLGGRSRHWQYRGHELGLGSHLVEDPGDSLTRVCELLGVTLEHSERSDSMPFWDRTGWKPIQEYYGGGAKQGLKRCIEALDRDAVRGARHARPPLAARVDAALHVRRGRLPRLGGDLGARADHRALVGPLGLGEPLRAQAPLLAEAHGRLLVLPDRRLGAALERHGGRVRGARRRAAPARLGDGASSSRTPRSWGSSSPTGR